MISGLTKTIKEKQGVNPNSLPDRRQKIAQFESWLAENNARYKEKVCVCTMYGGVCSDQSYMYVGRMLNMLVNTCINVL